MIVIYLVYVQNSEIESNRDRNLIQNLNFHNVSRLQSFHPNKKAYPSCKILGYLTDNMTAKGCEILSFVKIGTKIQHQG